MPLGILRLIIMPLCITTLHKNTSMQLKDTTHSQISHTESLNREYCIRWLSLCLLLHYSCYSLWCFAAECHVTNWIKLRGQFRVSTVSKSCTWLTKIKTRPIMCPKNWPFPMLSFTCYSYAKFHCTECSSTDWIIRLKISNLSWTNRVHMGYGQTLVCWLSHSLLFRKVP